MAFIPRDVGKDYVLSDKTDEHFSNLQRNYHGNDYLKGYYHLTPPPLQSGGRAIGINEF